MGIDDTAPPSAARRRRAARLARSRASAPIGRVSPPGISGELIAAITHDLRQPLTAVEMNISAAIVFLGRPAPQLAAAIDALTDALGQQRRVRDALQVLQHLAMQSTTQREPVDLAALAREVAQLAAPDALASQTVIELDIEPPPPPMSGDLLLVRQALLDLVLDALEAPSPAPAHAPPPAPLRIAVRTARTGTPSGGPAVEFEVTRAGEYAAESARGWGLALARSVVAAHGATIAVDATATHHRVVTRWPLHAPDPAARTAALSRSITGGDA